MTNLEKYAEEIKNYKGYRFCEDFVQMKILKPLGLGCDINCARCSMLQMIWANEEYTEPEVDWGTVEVDTPILVRDVENENWYRRYFAKYENGKVHAWINGVTSWSTVEDRTTCWNYAKLAEGEDE